MTLSVIVALADGFEEIEAVAPIDVLRRAGLKLSTVGITGKIVTGSHGVSLTADQGWSDVATATPDVLVLPGGMPGSKHLGEHPGLKTMAQRVAAANGYLAAICAAPAFTLGSWGLLADRNATCYPGCESLFPTDVKFRKDLGVVVDGRIVTACGPGVALDFSFALVELLLGAKAADDVRDAMQWNRRS